MMGLLWCSGAARATESMDLVEAYDTAVINAPFFGKAASSYQGSQARQQQAFGLLLPDLGVQGKLNPKYTFNGWISEGLTRRGTLGAAFRQMVFDFSSIKFYDTVRKQTEADYAAYQYKTQAFTLKIAKAYFDVLLARKNVKVARQQRKAYQFTFIQQREQRKLGQANISDLKQAEAGLYQADAALTKAENEYLNSLYRLAALMGVERNSFELVDLKDDMAITMPNPDSMQEWVDMALANNQRLRQANLRKQASYHAIDVCRGTFMPSISFNAGYYFVKSPIYQPGFKNAFFKFRPEPPDMTDIHPSSKCLDSGKPAIKPSKYTRGWRQLKGTTLRTFQFSLNLTWNFGNGGSDYARLNQASERYEADRYQALEIRRDIERTTKQNYLSVLTAIATVKQLKAAKKTSDLAYNMLYEQHKLGQTPFNQVLQQIQITYRNAYRLAEARFTYLLNLLKLKLDAGVLSRDDLVKMNVRLASQA